MKTKLLGTVAVAGFISYTGEQVWADGSFVLHKQKNIVKSASVVSGVLL